MISVGPLPDYFLCEVGPYQPASRQQRWFLTSSQGASISTLHLRTRQWSSWKTPSQAKVPPPSGSFTEFWLVLFISVSETRMLMFSIRPCHATSICGSGFPANGFLLMLSYNWGRLLMGSCMTAERSCSVNVRSWFFIKIYLSSP